MNSKKRIIPVIAISTLFSTGLIGTVFAQENLATITGQKSVTFTVTIGKLECRDGKGWSNISFGNTPEEGGYYEVFGKTITENQIALGRKVDLPTGSYTWKGSANDGYYIEGKEEGAFVIAGCAQKPTPSTSGTETKPTEIISEIISEQSPIESSEASATSTPLIGRINTTKNIVIAFIVAIVVALIVVGKKEKKEI